MIRRGTFCLLLLLQGAFILSGGRAGAQGWNQWRGPNRDGRIAGFRAPEKWPAKLARKWKVEVGEGHASPLAVGDSAYVFTRQGESEVVRRLDLATGHERWKK